MKSFFVIENLEKEIREIPTPKYTSKQALVKMIACSCAELTLSCFMEI